MAPRPSPTDLFSREELTAALRASGVGVWSWLLAEDQMRWSAETARLLGAAPERLEGSFDDFKQLVHPDDREGVEDALRRSLEEHSEVCAVEYRVPLRDGRVRWISSVGRVLADERGEPTGMTGAAVDITGRKTRLEQHAASEKRYRLFTEQASDYVYEVDVREPQLAPSIVAGSFERTTGYTPQEVAELGGWFQVMHPDDQGDVDELFAATRKGHPFVNEYRIVRKDGEVRWLRDRVLPVLDPNDGELSRLVGGVQDITDRKQLEEQLLHHQKMEALARLAGAVAHDFNNLLTVMFGAVDVLRGTARDAESREAAADLDGAVRRAADLTASLLAFGRRRVAMSRVVELGQMVERCAPMLRRAVGERVRVEMRAEDPRARVSIDPGQIDLVLLNLALNARDAMPEGGELHLIGRVLELGESDRERPAELQPGEYAAIEVVDTGTGIAPDVLERLFEPFFTTKPPGKGTGLGLATAHGIARQMGGTLRASQLGQGATFTLLLPLTHDAVDAVEPSAARHSVGGTECVLLVEDNAGVRALSLRVLTELGYRVTSVESAEQALEQGLDFDLLLTDVRLPGRPGTELAEELSGRAPRLRVLLMSGLVEDREQKHVIESGRFAFLPKPFVPEGLARRVREVLDA